MSAGWSSKPTSRMATIPDSWMKAMANAGVWCTGCSRPNRGDTVPAWPIVYKTRDAAFVQASPTPMALLMMAITTNHHPAPQSAWPSS